MRRQAAPTIAEQIVRIANVVEDARIPVQVRRISTLVDAAAPARPRIVRLARHVRRRREAHGRDDVLGVRGRDGGLGGEARAAEGIAEDLAALGVSQEHDLGVGARGRVAGDCLFEVYDAGVLAGLVVVEGGRVGEADGDGAWEGVLDQGRDAGEGAFACGLGRATCGDDVDGVAGNAGCLAAEEREPSGGSSRGGCKAEGQKAGGMHDEARLCSRLRMRGCSAALALAFAAVELILMWSSTSP